MAELKTVGRFAPTPSGRMHLGNVFAALMAWLSVRSKGGEMVLRMEDLDTQRTSGEYARILREDLRWLGLDYDRETPPQSARSAVYDTYFDRLAQMGLLYPQPASQRQRPPLIRRHLRLPRHLPESDGGAAFRLSPRPCVAGSGAGQGVGGGRLGTGAL